MGVLDIYEEKLRALLAIVGKINKINKISKEDKSTRAKYYFCIEGSMCTVLRLKKNREQSL